MAKSRPYTARKVRDAGRNRWSVIYRHPARIDPATGNTGRRVRRGLGTSDEAEADRLVAELNQLLEKREYWSLSARSTVEDRFNERVVSVFFDGMEPTKPGASAAERENVIPMPGSEDGYKKILLLGTTGAGKTTVVRQLLGTHPEGERFPSTSTAKTTIADTEIIISSDRKFNAVVTFARRDEVYDHLTDCASKAALAIFHNPLTSGSEFRRYLLDHENQRFRFSYVLGRDQSDANGSDGEFSDFEEEFGDFEEEEANSVAFHAEPDRLNVDTDYTNGVVDESLSTLRELVDKLRKETYEELVDGQDDERIVNELIEEELDRELRAQERFNELVDDLFAEIEKRFDALEVGELRRDSQGWPLAWTWETEDRIDFLKAVNRFSSNYAPLFGELLSPLVDGIRVKGRFKPEWRDGEPAKLVLIDGEGLGHTPKSAAVISTPVSNLIEEADAVMLVDNAAQPMQAAPSMAVRSILTSGSIEKLVFCFTHFDEVSGDNLISAKDRAKHVIASVENLVSSFKDDFHIRAARQLRNRLKKSRFFLGHINQPLVATDRDHSRTLNELKKLVEGLQSIGERPEIGDGRPEYSVANLVFSIQAAIEEFHRRWDAVLGRKFQSDIDKEHWTRVKALNRRFAEGTADQYDTLRPSAELREFLKGEIYKTLEMPLRWNPPREPDDTEKDAILDAFLNAIANRLYDPIRGRMSEKSLERWQKAYRERGTGSTFRRAQQISVDIFGQELPIPGQSASVDQNNFLNAILNAINEAADERGIKLCTTNVGGYDATPTR